MIRRLEGLSLPSQRGIAIALLVLLLAAGGLAAAGPYWIAASLREEVHSTTMLVAAEERVARVAGVHLTSAAVDEAFLPGQTSGTSAAELQRLATELADRSGLSVHSIQVVSARREQGMIEVMLQITLRAMTENLRNFVHRVETGLPLLFIDEMTIRSAPRQGGSDGPIPLDVVLKIRGYGASKESN